MAKLSRDDVLYLAQLARLDLSDGEVGSLLEELPQILEYVEKLQEVDTNGLKPTNQVTGLENVMRTDSTINYGYEAKDLLENVPEVRDDQIKVRRMV